MHWCEYITLWSRHCPVNQTGTVLTRASGKRSFYQSNSRAIVSASHLLLYSPRLDWQETCRSAGFMPLQQSHSVKLGMLGWIHPGTMSHVTTWCRWSTADDVFRVAVQVSARTLTKESSLCLPARAVMCWVHVEPKGTGSCDQLTQSCCTGLTWTSTHHCKTKASSVTIYAEHSGFNSTLW